MIVKKKKTKPNWQINLLTLYVYVLQTKTVKQTVIYILVKNIDFFKIDTLN